jgi:hypothetical protein
VPIIDCGIPVVEDDAAYRQGLAADAFIKDASGKPFTGQVVSAAHISDHLPACLMRPEHHPRACLQASTDSDAAL